MSPESNPSVLIADDDKEICKLVEITIKPVSRSTKIAHTGKRTIELIKAFAPNIIILDLNLPDIDGFSICSWIRKNQNIVQPIVIMLTARSSDKDKITGFDIGADEYISKPFSIMFLCKRLEILWKQKNLSHIKIHNTQKKNTNIQYNNITLNVEQKQAFINKSEINLTFMEWQILLLLMKNPKHVFSRSNILKIIKGDHYIIYERTIDVHLSSLRKKLGTYSKYIRTKRSMGYYFDNS